jgi:hypothetical protein
MNDTTDERLSARAQQVNADGETKFGKDGWQSIVSAISRAAPSPEMVANTVRQPDAVQQFSNVGKNLLLREMSESSDPAIRRDAEAAYDRIRQKEKSERHSSSAYRQLWPNMTDRR